MRTGVLLRYKLTEKMELFYFTRKCNSYLLGSVIPAVNALLLLQLLVEGLLSGNGACADEPHGLFLWLLHLCCHPSCLCLWVTTAEDPVFSGNSIF